MKKRLLAMLMALALLVSLMPMGVLADGGQDVTADNTYDDKETAKEATGVTANKTISEPDANGNYTITLSVEGFTDKEPSTTYDSADIVLVVDTSTSMDDNVSYGRNRLDVAKDAAETFVNGLLETEGANIKIGLYDFSGSNRTNVALTDKQTELLEKIDDLDMPRRDWGVLWGDGTHYDLGLEGAENILEKGSGENQFIVFISDGEPSYGHSGTVVANRLKDSGVTIFSIGVDVNWDATDLRNIASSIPNSYGNKYYYSASSSGNALNEVLSQISDTITQDIYAGTNAIMTDVINTEDFDVVTQASGAGVSVNGDTITWDIGNIGDTKKSITFTVKPKVGEYGTLYTNNDVSLTFNSSELNGKKVTFEKGAIGDPFVVVENKVAPSNSIAIEVVLDGDTVNKITDSGVEQYITVNPVSNAAPTDGEYDVTGWDEGTFANGTVTYNFTNYDCKDIKLNANAGYLVEAIQANLVAGQTNCNNITVDGGVYTVDNVDGGSTVTVYVRTNYTVNFNRPDDTVQSSVTNLVSGKTEGLPNSSSLPDPVEPVLGDYYTDGSEYEKVSDEPGDNYATASGKQPATTNIFVNNFEQTVTIPKVDGSTTPGTTNVGWWLNDTTCLGDPTHDADDTYTVSADDANEAHVINFYSKSTENTYTVKWNNGKLHTLETDENVPYGSEPSFDKNTPERTPTNEYTYEFVGWSEDVNAAPEDAISEEELPVVIKDVTYYAVFKAVPREYKINVSYVNEDGEDVKMSDYRTAGYNAEYNVLNGDLFVQSLDHNSVHYVFDYVKTGEGCDPATGVVTRDINVTLVYSVDEIGPNDGPDDIPDKYQAVVKYVADEGGSITGITSEVLTIRDQNNNLVESGTVTASGSTAAADANYAFDYWTLDDTRIDADATFSNYELTVSGGQTYTFTAHFKANNPDIDITKTASVNGHTLTAGETVEVGDVITYTITVKNDGNVAFENLKVSDDMWGEDVEVEVKIGDVFYPANLAGNETDGYFLYIADEINHPGEFKPGETWTCRYTYKVVDTDAGETITNTAVVDGETDGEDTVEITVNDPSVSINKTVTGYNDKAMEGDELTYTITVTNTGNTKLDVTVSDDMWTYGKVSSAELNGVGIDVTSGKYTIFGLDAGESKDITYTYTVTAQDVAKGKIDNAATADIDGDGMPDDKYEVTTPTGDPSLTVEKTADASTVQVGTPITYTVEVKNDGYSVMNNVVISDTLWTSDTAIEAIGDVTGEYDTGESKYYIGKLEPGEYVTLTYTYTPTEARRLENKVTVTSDDLDTVPEDSVIVEVTPEPTPDEPGISVTKNVSDRTPDVGDTITYYIIVENTGNTVIDEFTVKDSMWEYGMPIYVDGEPAYVNSDDAYTVKTADLEPGSSITISYTYSVRYADEGDRITNYVTVTTPGDGPSDGDYVIIDVDDITPIVPDPDDDDDDTVYVPNWLNTTDHYSYIVGYEDGTIRPNNNITRAEVATIFFRLLTDDARARFWSSENDYTDVATDSWYNNAVSTLSNMGIINGYDDGTFQPNASITRAEFTAIATRFFDYTAEYDGAFNDVASGSWYADYVQAAVDMGLVDGYPDGGFHPNSYITRAEAVTIVNRVLNRVPHEDYLLSTRVMNTWPDNVYGAWYYADMQEATNSHDYDWIRVSGERVEEWTEKLTERDWAALEQEWSTAYSG